MTKHKYHRCEEWENPEYGLEYYPERNQWLLEDYLEEVPIKYPMRYCPSCGEKLEEIEHV